MPGGEERDFGRVFTLTAEGLPPPVAVRLWRIAPPWEGLAGVGAETAPPAPRIAVHGARAGCFGVFSPRTG